jgi:ATP-dependent helicase/nuclease subunit B
MPIPKLECLHRIIEQHPLQRKVLIVRSFTSGHQWIQRLSRKRGPIQRVEVQTVESLALHAARLKLYESGKRFLSREEIYWLVMSIMVKLGRDDRSYVLSAMVTPGIVTAFHKSICELRESGLTADRLEADWFEHTRKGNYIRDLLREYEEALERENLVDFAGLPQYVEPLGDALIILDDTCRLTNAAEMVIHQLSEQRKVLCSNESFTEPNSGFPFQALSMFQALGSLAEIKETFRRIASRYTAWDHVEIVLSNYAAYVPKVYALLRSLGIPCSFAQGLPFRASSLGNAALTCLEWIESDFHVDSLVQAFRHGMLCLPHEVLRVNDAIRVLETSGIGWGQNRYALLRSFTSDQDHLVETALHLAEDINDLLDMLPNQRHLWSCAHVAKCVARFIESCHKPVSQGDADALRAIRGLQNTMERWGQEEIGASMAIRLIRELFESSSVEVVGIPEPGKIFISSLENGGQTGRENTFLLGMDEEQWSLSFRQDPVLLDMERSRINKALKAGGFLETSDVHALRIGEERNQRIGGIRGHVSASFSNLRLSDHKECSPAYEMLQLYRIMMETPAADFNDLARFIANPTTTNKELTTLNITHTDYLLNELTTSRNTIRDGFRSVLIAYPHLNDGLTATNARKETNASIYDGVLRADLRAEGFMPTSFSASKLESYAKCPLQFFYAEVLGVRKKDSVIYDRTRWLDPKQRGSLLHLIYFTYMSETMSASGNHNRSRLTSITERILRETLHTIPTPSVHVYEKDCESIRADTEVFYQMEQQRRSQPTYFELELHHETGVFQLELSDELTMPLRGFVDRIDETAPHQYQVIDYKTGNPKVYDDGSFYAGGKQIQHALYALAVQQWLRRSGKDPSALVTEAGYAFPTQRGLGEEAMRPQVAKREETIRLLQSAVTAIEQGLFPPTNEPKKCSFCDYKFVCGSHAEWMRNTWNFPQNRERLAPLLEVTQCV